MKTRLQNHFQKFQKLSEERKNMYIMYRSLGKQPPLEKCVDYLYQIEEAKQTFTKQYHGIRYETMFKKLKDMERMLYQLNIEYESKPTEEKKDEIKVHYDKIVKYKRIFYGYVYNGF